ncbi:MAG: NusA-like transcription termination signal-binding factor [Candidatus Woesearchaeota archaeon]
MNQTLDTNALMQMSLFEKITKAKVKDCFESNGKLTFVVSENQLQKAIGPKGANVKKLEQLFKKKLRIIQFDPDIAKFIENLCYPNKVRKVEFGSQMLWNKEKKAAIIIPENLQARGYIIGKDANNLRVMETICRRYFSLDEIRVESAEKTEAEEKNAQIGQKIDDDLTSLDDTDVVVDKEEF